MESRCLLLLADEHAAQRQRLAGRLAADGYVVSQAATRDGVVQSLATVTADALILADLDPATNTASLIADLRAGKLTAAGREMPVVVLSSEPRELALLQCFKAGADDFLAKWVTYPELRARIRGLLARSHARARAHQTVGPLSVDLESRVASWNAQPLRLSNLEFALLAKLAADPTRLHAKQELLRDVWGFATPVKTRVVDAHARQLRSKLTAAGADGWVVKRHGLGYQLIDHRSVATDGPLGAAQP